MARIAGINIPTDKHIVIGLQSIFGIGQTRSKLICETLKLDASTKVSELSESQLESIRVAVSKYEVEGDLRREIAMNIKRLKSSTRIHSVMNPKISRSKYKSLFFS